MSFGQQDEEVKFGHDDEEVDQQDKEGFFSHAGKTLKKAAKDVSLVGTLPGLGEVAAGGIGDLANAAVSGIYGPVKSVFSGKSAADEIVDTQEKIKKAIPYSPETESGKAMYDVLGLLPEGIHAAGETAFEKTNSPLLGAGLEALGNAALLGIPGMKKGKRAPKAEKIDPVAALEKGFGAGDEIVKTTAPEGYVGNIPLERNLNYGEYLKAKDQALADRAGQGEMDLRPKDMPVDENGMPYNRELSMDVQDMGRQVQSDLFPQAEEAAGQTPEKMAQEAAQKQAMLEEPAAQRQDISADIERAYSERAKQLENETAEQRKAAKEEELYQIQEARMEGRPIPKSTNRVPKGQRGALNIQEIGDGFQAIKDGKVVGYLKDNLPRGLAKQIGENANVDMVKVAPEVKGQGVGRALYDAFNEKHEGNIAPSGKTSPDAWKLWKRNFPDKVDKFVEQEAARIRDGADPQLVVGNITDPAVAQRVMTQARSPMRVPLSQRGVLLFGSPEPKGSRLSAATRESPEIVSAKDQLLKEKKQAMVKDVLQNPMFDAYTSRIDSPEKVIALAPDAKDIGPVQAKKASTVSPGMNSVAISSNNPLLKYTRDAVGKTTRATEHLVRQFITGPDGFGTKLKKLSQEEKNQVVGALQAADKKQRALTREEMTKAGFSEKQIDFIEHVQKMDAVKLDIWNKARTELGLPTVTAREGHFAGNFSGDYRTLVYDKNKNIVGVVTTNTALGNKAVQKKVLAQHPDVSFADTKRMGLGGSSAKANIFTGLEDIMNVLAKGDPRFAKIQEVVDAAIKDRGDSLYGASLHAEAKKGIWGNEGNKFWKDKNENTRDALKAFTEYWESGIASHLNLTTEVKLKELLDNPALDHMPRAKQYVDNYIKQATGRSLGTLGDALNTIIDTPGRLTGFGPTVVREAVTQFNKRASQLTMGFINPLFLATQVLQVPQMAFPELIKIQRSLGMGPEAFSKATTKAVADGMKMAKEEFTGKKADVDSFTRGAYDYAKDNGLLAFSEFNNARDIFQNKYSKGFDVAADWGRTKIEQATKPYVFFSAAELLKESGLSPKEAYDTALNITNHAMINYHAAEKPMIYSRLGVLGNAAGALQTFKHAYLGQLGTFIKDAANGRPGPLVAAALAMFTFSGLKGIPGYQELDELVKAITDKFYKDRKSIADIALDKAPEWARSGVLSTSTGVNMQSRLSAADVLPNSPMEALSPFGSLGKKIGGAVADVAGNNDKLAWSNLAKEVAPSGTIKGMVESALKTKDVKDIPQQYRNDSWKNDGTVTYNKRGEVDYIRTPEDVHIRKYLGGTSLKESLDKEKTFNAQENARSRREEQKKVVAKAENVLAQLGPGEKLSEDTMKKLVKDYQEQKGDPEQLISSMIEFAKNKNLTSQQRLQGIPNDSLSSLYRYQNYNK